MTPQCNPRQTVTGPDQRSYRVDTYVVSQTPPTGRAVKLVTIVVRRTSDLVCSRACRPRSTSPAASRRRGILCRDDAAEPIEIRRLDAAQARSELDALAAVLFDCVDGGASVSYMAPFPQADARDAFDGFVDEVERGRRLLLAAYDGGRLVGTCR